MTDFELDFLARLGVEPEEYEAVLVIQGRC